MTSTCLVALLTVTVLLQFSDSLQLISVNFDMVSSLKYFKLNILIPLKNDNILVKGNNCSILIQLEPPPPPQLFALTPFQQV